MPTISDPRAFSYMDKMSSIVPLYNEPVNYIYLYHTNKIIKLPTWPENMTDSSSASFQSSSPLGRSAPIWSYSNSGPRSIGFQFDLHRELLDQFNGFEPGRSMDTVDTLINEIQAAVLPTYASSSKMVDPPLVAVRVGNDIYIKGIINGAVSIGYSGPILYNDKYALVNIGFTVTEVDPYDAETVMRIGSYRYSNDIPMSTNLSGPVYGLNNTSISKIMRTQSAGGGKWLNETR